MRIANVSWVILLLATVAHAQYPPMSYVEVETPTDGCIVVMHPTRPATVFLPDGNQWLAFDVRVGQSSYNHWGECWFEEPVTDAEFLIVQTQDDVDGLVVLDTPLPLDSLPDLDGWTTVDLAHLRGGGHGEHPVPLRAYVPDHTLCYLDDGFSLYLRSTDINGDLMVDLTDIVLFTQVLGGDYRNYADFQPDGFINLSDIVVLVQAIYND